MRRLLFVGILAALALAGQADRVENGLRPRIQIKGEPEIRWSIGERQGFHKTPAVSVAVMRGGAIAWAKAWGAMPDDLFQAASISKPIAAVTALRLVADGKLSLDEDVNEKLKSWKVPANSFGKPVTLRMLLSHTAGLTVHGFRGYADGERVPTLVQLLNGTGPANSEPIRVDIEPGTKYRYSGGGYEVVQLLIEDVTGKPFAQVAKAFVLDAAGMKSSTYDQLLMARAAPGHNSDGKPVPGRWHSYPELAAAGLWTTPSDLARFLIAVRANKLLPVKLTEEMLTVVKDNYGLGFGIDGKQFGQNGANVGYRCAAMLYRDSGDGMVVMTNSDRGMGVGGELQRAIAEEFGWPTNRVVVREAVRISAAELAPLLGSYGAGRVTVSVTPRTGGGVTLGTPEGPMDFMPESPTKFFSLSEGPPTLLFERNAEGAVTGFTLGNIKARKRP